MSFPASYLGASPISSGIPSITQSGSVGPESEAVPLSLIGAICPGVPDAGVTSRPGTLPCSIWSMDATAFCSISFIFTTSTEDVILLFSIFWKPVMMTSSISLVLVLVVSTGVFCAQRTLGKRPNKNFALLIFSS